MAKKNATSRAVDAVEAGSVSMGLKVNEETAAKIDRIIAHISHPGVTATKSDAVRFAITFTAAHLTKAA